MFCFVLWGKYEDLREESINILDYHVEGGCLFMCTTLKQGRNMVYGLRAQSPKYDWDQGSEQRAQGSEEWDQGSQGFWAQIRDQIYYTV